jgi:TetR/AcrR family transcriptional regulator
MNTKPTKRDLDKLRRREEILDAAELVFSETGANNCTMDQVAKAAGISRPLLYVYFKDRSELQLGVGVRALQQLLALFKAASESEKLGLRKVMAIGQAYVDFAREEPFRFSVLSMCEAQGAVQPSDSDLGKHMLELGSLVHQQTTLALSCGVNDGSIRANLGDLDMVSRSLWALTHGTIQLAQSKPAIIEASGGSLQSFFQCSMEMALHSLIAR